VSSPLELPARPDLHWLKNRAKERLAEMRAANPEAKLAEAQVEVARAYGFPSWRALKARVDAIRAAQDQAAQEAMASPESVHDRAVGAFLHSVGTGNLEAVTRMLALAPQLVHAVGPHPFWGGRPQALHVAIESNRPELFELLLARGANVDGDNREYGQWSPLLLSVHWKRPEWTRELLERGARVGLVEALALADDARVDQILDADGARALESPPPNSGTYLHFARTTHAIDRLLALGVPSDRKDQWGATPIEALSRLGPAGAALVAHLVAGGVAVGPAELARLGDRKALERWLARDPDAVHAPTTLKAAVDFGHLELARWLIAQGCDVNGRGNGPAKETPLHSAAWNGNLEMVRMLVDAGADLHARDVQYDGVPLGWAETAIEVTNNPKCAEVVEFLRART
jgi:Ankyrin repeats (many copies)